MQFYDEPCSFESAYVIPTVQPDVIVLPEEAETFAGAENRGPVHSCSPRRRDRNLEYGPTTRLENTNDFSHRLAVIWNVLQNVITNNHIEALVPEAQRGDIRSQGGQRRSKVGTDVSDVFASLQNALQILFGREVQHAKLIFKYRGAGL